MRKSSPLVAIPIILRGSGQMGCSISSPRQRNRVCPDAALLGVTTVLDPVSKQLKDINHWVVRVIEEMADAEVGAEGPPVFILG